MHPDTTVVYKDEKVKDHYLDYGFAVVENFLSEQEIQTILQTVQSHENALANTPGFSTSTDNNDSSFRIAMREVINNVVNADKTKKYFEGYTAFYSNLLIKKSQARSEMVLHTDWSITDEAKYLPLQIWIPLVDVNKDNGTLAVVPGSHHFTNVYRGCQVDEPYMKYEKDVLKDFLYFLEVKKGTAVLYHPGILHYSPSNLSDSTRLAILVSYYPTAMNPVLYYQKKFNLLNKISVYDLTPDFFNTWDKKSPPSQLKKVCSVGQVKQQNGKNDFLSNLEQYRYEKRV